MKPGFISAREERAALERLVREGRVSREEAEAAARRTRWPGRRRGRQPLVFRLARMVVQLVLRSRPRY
jgi:hypothetical protein